MTGITEKIGKLGFGLMRLPTDKDGMIDIEQTKKMVDLFMDAGYNYFDTAWAYKGSEDAIRQALVERYPREKFILATKNAAWIDCKTREDAIKQFETSMKQTGSGYIDFYLLHNLGGNRTRVFDEFGLWDFVKELKSKGLIKHYGISVHCTSQELDDILTAHPDIEFVQLQINYADWESPHIQSRLCYEIARKHGKPIIVMEPVKGGLLAKPPECVEKILKEANPNATPVSWALKFPANLDGVLTVLTGMSNVEQMKESISIFKNFDGFTESEEETINKARTVLENLPIIPCTSCEYCAKVCPENIGISGTFIAANMYTLYNNKEFAVANENWNVLGQGKVRADKCIKCGLCEDACPQHIDIRNELEKAVAELGLKS